MASWVLIVAEDAHRQSIVRADLEEAGFEVDHVAADRESVGEHAIPMVGVPEAVR